MRFAPTEDQLEFAAAVRALLQDTCDIDALRRAWGGEVGAHTAVTDGAGHGDGRVRPAWEALTEMGVLGLTVPEAHGGLGMGDDDLVGILVECGRAGLPDPVADTAGVAAAVLSAVAGGGAAGGEAAAAWLERIAGGASVVVGFGPSPLVAGAGTADAVLVFSGDPVSGAQAGAPAAYLLDPAGPGAPGPGITAVESVDGARALARVSWSPEPAAVLAEGAAAAQLEATAFDRAAVLQAALLVGLSTRMLEMTVEYVGERRQFGVPVGSFQAVKHQLADAALGVEFAEPLVRYAAHLLDPARGAAPADVAVAASMAKSRASRAAVAASEAALQCHGAIGYTVEADLHLFMKRAWALARSHGDADWHLGRVRRHLLAP